MLLEFDRFEALDGRKLMDIYAGDNRENAADLYPGMEPQAGVRRVEEEFLAYLRDDFFSVTGNRCLVWEEDGEWLSALRLYPLEDGGWYIEALAARPDRLRRGYGSRVLSATLDMLRQSGPFVVRDCVGKSNAASLATHRKCGFTVASEPGHDFLTGQEHPRCYGMEYRWNG